MNTVNELALLIRIMTEHGAAPTPYSGAARSTPLERRLGFRLPMLYRALVDGYEWLPFEARGLFVYGSLGDTGERDDIMVRLFLDPMFIRVLTPARLFHFAAPDTGSYDPICVDLVTPGSTDGPVVRLHHEEILCHEQIRVTARVSDTFRELWLAESPV